MRHVSAGTCVLLLGLLSLSASADTLFPCPQYDIGQWPYPSAHPYSVALNDLDGDGHQDMAVANYGDDNISILMNRGDGTFANQQTYDVGEYPTSVAIEDLDGDDDLDLAVANSAGGGTVSILLNSGNGTFADQVSYEIDSYTGGSVYSIAVQDLDGDGDADLAVPKYTGQGTISILLNNGDGTFAGPVVHAVCGYGNYPSFVTIADLDGDDDGDLAVATDVGLSDDCVSIFLNHGDGSLAPCVQYIVGGNPNSIAAKDRDGDGDLDLAVANRSTDDISILLNNGNGTFAEHVTYGTGDMPFSIAAEDLDGDDDADLVTANREENTVSVLRNGGDGTFCVHEKSGTGTAPYSVAIADLDSDGHPDVVTADYSGQSVTVLRNQGDADLRSYSSNGLGIVGGNVAIGDLDGDEDQDLVYAPQDLFGRISIALNLGGASSPPERPARWETRSV